MAGKKIAYIRVSSIEQNPERQLDGLTFDKKFVDKVSGKTMKRPQLDAMLDYVRDGDTVIVHSMDRLARNLDDLRKIVMQLTSQQVSIEFLKENLKFNGDDSPMSTLLLSVMGAFAEFERALIRERQAEGIALAKQRGAYTGRKPCLTAEQADELRRRAKAGEKKAKLMKEFGLARSTLYKYLSI